MIDRDPYVNRPNALQFCLAFALLCLLLITSALILPGSLYAQEKEESSFTFAAVGIPLSDAFDQFIERSGISVAFEIDLVKGKKAFCRAVDLEVEEAIKCLLKDTNLDYIRLSSGTYVLVEQAEVAARWGGITGRIIDAESGEPLPNAHVLLADAGLGDVTNGSGRFAFSQLKPGPHRLVVSYLGYQDVADTVNVAPDGNARVELGLNVEPLVSSPVVINGFAHRYSSETLYAEEQELADLLDASTGQDVIRSLNTIIGVRVSDALADVHVQGGDAGEHQYRLDGAPVFVPIPNGGVIGPFSPFALKKFTVHKAGFAADKGSYLSGVIEAEHQLAAIAGNTFDVQLDPVSLNAKISGSSVDPAKLGVNWMITGRKSLWSIYQPTELQTHFNNWSTSDLHLLNALLPHTKYGGENSLTGSSGGNEPYVKHVAEDERSQFTQSDFNNTFDFFDLHGAVRLDLSPLSSLRTSFYYGGNDLGDNSVVLGSFSPRDPQYQLENQLLSMRNDYRWLNMVSQVTYERVLGNKTFGEWGVWYSRFDGTQSFEHDSYKGLYKGDRNGNGQGGGNRPPPDSLATYGMGYDDQNEISEFGFRSVINHSLGERNFLTAGLEFARDESNFVLNLQGNRNVIRETPNEASIQAAQTRLVAYLDNKYSLNEQTSIDAGIRLTYLGTHGQVYAEPRVSLRHDATDGPLGPWAFRSAVGLYRQFINQFDISSVNRNALVPSMRFWLPVDESQNPSRAFHASSSVILMPHKHWKIRGEAYYKWQPHLLVIDYANPMLFGFHSADIATQDDLLHSASGFAYGAAIAVERETEQLTTRLQYEYSVAEQQISNRFNGESLSVPWNVPHRINTSFSYRVTDQLTVLSRLENRIGQSWAFRGAYYNFLEPNPRILSLDDYDLSDPTAHKLPVISHLDFGVSFSQQVKNTNLQVRFELSNILSYSNVEEWSLGYDQVNDVVYKVERPLTPFLPSVVVRLGF